jgi:hypothetical protein
MRRAKISVVPIVTICAPPTTYCHDNFGYCARKSLIQKGVFRIRGGPRFALHHAVTYAPGFVVVDTDSTAKG